MQVIHYYLVDDTVEIREVHEPNDGRDPFPVLLCRQKLPKYPRDVPCKSMYTLMYVCVRSYLKRNGEGIKIDVCHTIQ